MMHAPEMSPTLDDALRALDGASVTGVISAPQLAAVSGFLEQLDAVRGAPALLVHGRAVAEHLEGAYQAGARCADESGQVLVMNLPAFLSVCPPRAPAPERTLFPSLGLVLAGVCLLIAANTQNPWWLAASLCGAVAWLVGLPASPCTQNCGQGDRCSCMPPPAPVLTPTTHPWLAFDNDELDHWKARALAAEKKIRDEQFARLFAVPNGGKHAG
jgi:hypothetical protein